MTSALVDAVSVGFAERFGRGHTGIWRAPGRVNLVGEHTDYNNGFVLPFAIDRDTVVALAPRADRVVRIASSFTDETIEISLDDLGPDAISGWSAYPLGVVWALGEHGADLARMTGFDGFIHSEVPVGAGLSSSAAIESATAIALRDVWQLDLDLGQLARVGRLAENVAVGAPTGIMDQSASLLGERDSAVFLDCRSLDSEVIPLSFSAHRLELLVIDTRVSHAHATGGYAARRASCERGAAALGVDALRDVAIDDLDSAQRELDDETFRRVRHVVTENQRVLDTVRTLRTEGPAAVGDLLVASHTSMRDDFEISAPELDVAVQTALEAGAVGARMTGGGFGGSAIALVRSADLDSVRRAVVRAFSAHGFTAPGLFTVHAAAGASRVS
ncbi:galactokinase [Okibacterium endophyticum]